MSLEEFFTKNVFTSTSKIFFKVCNYLMTWFRLQGCVHDLYHSYPQNFQATKVIYFLVLTYTET